VAADLAAVVAFAATFPNSRYDFSVPFLQWLARLNKVGLNRVAKHVAPSLPGMGVVVHKGRRSGRTYQTPANVFRTPDGFVIALTYGAEKTEWVKNIVAAGGCEVRTAGRSYQSDSPRVYHDETGPASGRWNAGCSA
jgi:deazaflavin-dependent oxidoreductase (nitroreductase family)